MTILSDFAWLVDDAFLPYLIAIIVLIVSFVIIINLILSIERDNDVPVQCFMCKHLDDIDCDHPDRNQSIPAFERLTGNCGLIKRHSKKGWQ